jgi:hypothetical protein
MVETQVRFGRGILFCIVLLASASAAASIGGQ